MVQTSSQATGNGGLVRRLAEFLAIVLGGSVAVGVLRGLVAFFPGIFGMAAGGLAGYLCGRAGRRDCDEKWPPGQRLWLALGAALLYGTVTAATVSVLRTGLMGAPLEWLVDVIGGSGGEFFFGTSRNSYQSVSGTINGAWWVVFNLLDIVLFLPLFFVASVAGFDSGVKRRRPSVVEDSAAPVMPGTPASSGSEPRRSSAGLAGCAVFACAAAVVLAGLALGPGIVHTISGAPSADDVMWSLQGEWVFGEEAGFLGATDSERTFTMARVFADELAGMPDDPTRFMLTLDRRRGGVFEGRLTVRGRDVLPVRMQPTPDGQVLEFVIDWWGPGGRSERRISARRIASGEIAGTT